MATDGAPDRDLTPGQLADDELSDTHSPDDHSPGTQTPDDRIPDDQREPLAVLPGLTPELDDALEALDDALEALDDPDDDHDDDHDDDEQEALAELDADALEALAGLDDDDRPELPRMPGGDPMAAVCELVATEIESRVHTGGWQHEASLWTLRTTELDPQLTDETLDLVRVRSARYQTEPEAAELAAAVGPVSQTLTLACFGTTPGHPYDALIGLRFEPSVVGLALVCEGTVSEPADTPAGRPDAEHAAPALEMRNVSVVLRDGTTASVTRRFGGEASVDGPEAMDGGAIPGALRRCLGLPSQAFGSQRVHDVTTVGRRWWMWAAAALAAAVSADPEPMAGVIADVEWDVAAALRFACDLPELVIAGMPLPGPAFAAVLGETRGTWDDVLGTLGEIARERDDANWSLLAEWADPELLAAHVGTGPDARAAVAMLLDEGVENEVLDAFARFEDPSVPLRFE